PLRDGSVLAPRARAHRAEQRAEERRKRAGRALRSEIAIANLETDDPGTRLLVNQPASQGEGLIDETRGDFDVRIQKQQPTAAAQPAPFVGRPSEPAILSPASHRHPRPAPQPAENRSRGRMIIDNDNFHRAPFGAGTGEHLAGEPLCVSPLTVIDDHDGEIRSRPWIPRSRLLPLRSWPRRRRNADSRHRRCSSHWGSFPGAEPSDITQRKREYRPARVGEAIPEKGDSGGTQ